MTITPSVDVDPIAPDRAALPLLAAVLVSTAGSVAAVLDILDPDTVGLLDAPTAAALAAAQDLARRGIDPTPTLLLDELQRVGALAGHHGQLIRGRLVDAATNYQPPERLWPLAAALSSQLLRARGAAAGETIAEGYRSASESDAYKILRREGKEVLELHKTVDALRGQDQTR